MTTTAIEQAPAQHASRLAQVTGFSDQVINLVAQNVAPGCTRLELATYLYTVSRAGFDPLIQPPLVHFIKYSKDSPAEIVVSVNGYRSRAANTGVYAGSDDAVFEYDPADDSPIAAHKYRAPSKATVTVWRLVGGMRVPFSASVRWTEFYPGDGKIGEQYRKRPHNQLAIRAETHALRKAFPNETGTLEVGPVPDEWTQAATVDETAKRDPELVAVNARRYDRVFGGEDDWAKPKVIEVDAETGEVTGPDELSEETQALLEDNKRLRDVVEELGGAVPKTLKASATWTLGDIKAANDELEQRINERKRERGGVVLEGQVELPA
jgi:hypothetical protein